MELPICLSQYFVNKQNVRSFKNIVKISFKCEQGEFLKFLFQGEERLGKFVNDDFMALLSTIKTNTVVRAKEDFKQHFKKEAVVGKPHLHAVNKDFVFENCWKTLNEIVPAKFTGINNNVKVFRSLIQTAIYSMRRQHIVLSKIIENWDFSVSTWQSIPDTEAKKILHHIFLWIINNILSAIISLNFYVTTCKVDADENKLHYFWKSEWQSFYDKQVSGMIFTKIIKKCEQLSLGTKLKKKLSPNKRQKLKAYKKDIPKLHLVLKMNNECRPIVQSKKDSPNVSEKYKMKERLKLLKILTGKPDARIETDFKELHQKWLNSNKPKLYFIKTDLSNAFGSVNKDKLLRILSDRHMQFQRSEKNIDLKKKMAQQYKEMILELRKPLLVRAGSTVFEWIDGLVQGYKYSPALSELYYTHMDEVYFADHLKKSNVNIKLFIRVVDDYLYITDSLTDAHSFLNALSNYRNVNYRKTIVNFEDENIKFSEEITFLGYTYNTVNLEVSRTTHISVGQMCYKIAFTGAISNIPQFIENRISQSGIHITGHIFNLVHNSENLIWQHIFTTFCLSANKFCTILAILCHEKEMLNFLALYKKRVVVKLSNAILETLLKNKPPNYLFVYCINHLRHISWKALYLCAKGTPKCSGLVPSINDELAKTNCLFGKWKEHASGINPNGEPFKSAKKEICRRPDLRIIVKSFNNLPAGFECYNHRKIVNKTN